MNKIIKISFIFCCLTALNISAQEQLCSFTCALEDSFFKLKKDIRCFQRSRSARNAGKVVEFAQRIAPQFIGYDSHKLACIEHLVFNEEDQILRWAVSQFMPKEEQRALNSLWFMIYNPEIIQAVKEDDYRIVYNGLELFRQATQQNDIEKQREVLERISFYFENRTIDFMAPLMKVAVRTDDYLFVEMMSMYLRPYEQLAFLVAWEINKLLTEEENKPQIK